MVLRDHLT